MTQTTSAYAFIAITSAFLLGAETMAAAQIPAPTNGTPTWTRLARMADGRTFVTDGALALDAAIAKPATLPPNVIADSAAKTLHGYMTAALPNEYRLSQLSKPIGAKDYKAPSGVVLNSIYIEYLRRVAPAASLRFRMKGEFDPVAILLDGKPVGVLMPVRSTSK